MNRLRNKLVLLFLGATIVPVLATVALTMALFNLSLTPARDLDGISRAIEQTGKEYYQQARQTSGAMRSPAPFSPSSLFFRTAATGPNRSTNSGIAVKPSISILADSGNLLELYRRDPAGVSRFIQAARHQHGRR